MPEIPIPDPQLSLTALRAMIRERSVMAALLVFHRGVGDVFQINLPGFKPVMLAGPEGNRFVLVEARDRLLWRPRHDPVTRLLRHGVLVEDGATHDELRGAMMPALARKQLPAYADAMLRCTDQVADAWPLDRPLDMLDEMRRVALLILVETLFAVDFAPDMPRLWDAILRILRYISPGLWMIRRDVPRPGYGWARQAIDAYLYGIIRERRAAIERFAEANDLLSLLVRAGLPDGLIRDQLLTMLIAGHDTSTALLAWTLLLLGQHPEAARCVRDEVDTVLGGAPPTMADLDRLEYLGRVISEALRLYPPIHLGTREATVDLAYNDYCIPAGTRVLYSTYLTHRHPAHWDDPDRFVPDRFLPERGRDRAHYTYLPFGGGPRNCIGMAFAQVESKIVLARLVQRFEFRLEPGHVHQHMGATLEPRMGRRGVLMRAGARTGWQP